MEKNRILLVDDSPNELRILMEVLKHDYAIVVAIDGETAIDMVKEDDDIELVLLDVNMPNKNGYETCQEILKMKPSMPIVFVSGNDSTEEILKGFDVGGIDYLTKPIDTNVVARKVKVILEERQHVQELVQENKTTSEMVMTVIASAGHLGTVLGFLRSGLKIKTHEGLVEALFDVFLSLNMDACLQLRTDKKVINRATNGFPTPLELDLLDRAGEMQQRFLERGSRYIVNFGTVSIIVKNMPTEEEAVRGELRDNLMMILEDTDALNQHLCKSAGQAIEGNNEDEVKESLLDAASTLNMLAQHHEAHKRNTFHLMEDFAAELEQTFDAMGLTESQEQALMEILNAKTTEFNRFMTQSMETEEAILSIQEQIKRLVNR